MAKIDPELVTKRTYDNSAAELADYFAGIGARNVDVDKAFQLAQISQPKVLELGCGDGRDAAYILSRTNSYLGVDYSREFIGIAKKRLPSDASKFLVADIRQLPAEVPVDNNIIFAFASLLHLKPEDMVPVLHDASTRLALGGVLYVSLKKSERHEEVVKEDEFGWRLFHYYSPDELAEMVPTEMEEVSREVQTIGSTNWFTAAFVKRDIMDG